MAKTDIEIVPPADVPKESEQNYIQHYRAITAGTLHLMLFACDQKIEHLNNDFYGDNIHPDAMHPEHLFAIASKGRIGAFATHLGLISRYGKRYKNINYIVKLNGKTNLIKTEERDPVSKQLWSVDDVVQYKQMSGLPLCGVGYTIYLGSTFEHEMLSQAAQIIHEAHQHGLVTILWIYPRGKAVSDDQKPNLVAGAAGVAASLGSDFVKVKPPKSAELLRVASVAAGNTKLICSGGQNKPPEQFLQELHDQIHIGGASGSATGRNIFQHSLAQAVAMTNAISAIVLDNRDVEAALDIYSAKNKR